MSQRRDMFAVVAGIADLGLETAESLVGRARGLLGRSDLPEMAADAHRDLKARGDVVLGRMAPPTEAHMETLARRVQQSRHSQQPQEAPAREAAGGA